MGRSRLVQVFVLGIVALSPVRIGAAAEIAKEFAQAHPDPKPVEFVKPADAALDISELAIERTACFGRCPVYSFRVKSDGSYTLDVARFAEPLGTRAGRIEEAGFVRVAWQVSQTRFFEYADNYTCGWTDLPTTYLKVVRGGKSKIISIYGLDYPLELIGVKHAIESLAVEAGLRLTND